MERARLAHPDFLDGPDGGDTVVVREALLGLTDRQRQVVVLRYYLDLTAEEAAEVLGIRSGAVRMLAHRAIAHLRGELGEPAKEVHDG